jgi:hypothetical protein
MKKNRPYKRGPKGLYPWDTWFKRNSITLLRGTHYNCPTVSMGQQIRSAAYKRKVGVTIKGNSDDSITITMHTLKE